MKKVLPLLLVSVLVIVACGPSAPKIPPVSSIRTRDDLMLHASIYFKVKEGTELKFLDPSDKDWVYPVVNKILDSEIEDFQEGGVKELMLIEFLGTDTGGSFILDYEEGNVISNGSLIIDESKLDLFDYTLAYDEESMEYTNYVDGTALYNGSELSQEEVFGLISDAKGRGSRETRLVSGRGNNYSWSFVKEISRDGENYDVVDKLYYKEKTKGKTITFCISPYEVYPHEGRTLEYISIDGVFYATKEKLHP